MVRGQDLGVVRGACMCEQGNLVSLQMIVFCVSWNPTTFACNPRWHMVMVPGGGRRGGGANRCASRRLFWLFGLWLCCGSTWCEVFVVHSDTLRHGRSSKLALVNNLETKFGLSFPNHPLPTLRSQAKGAPRPRITNDAVLRVPWRK